MQKKFPELALGFRSDLTVAIEQNHPREIGFAFHGQAGIVVLLRGFYDLFSPQTTREGGEMVFDL